MTKLSLISLISEELNSYENIEGWITPDNKIIKVPNQDHLGFIMSQFNLNIHSDDEEDIREIYYNHAYENGWVRFLNYSWSNPKINTISISSTNLNRIRISLKKNLSDLIRNDTNIMIEGPNGFFEDLFLSNHSDLTKFKIFLEGQQINEQYSEYQQYNAWINPDGELIKVPTHISYLKKHFNLPLSTPELYLKAFSEGWVRVIVTPDEVNVMAQNNHLIAKILYRFINKSIITKKHKIVHTESIIHDNYTFNIDNPSGLHKLKTFIKDNIKSESINEQQEPSIDSNTWVTPTGEHINLTNQSHAEFMRKYYKKNNPEFFKQPKHNNLTIMLDAIKNGWVRYHYFYGFNGDYMGEFVIDGYTEKHVSNVLYELLNKFILKREKKTINIFITSTQKDYTFSTDNSYNTFQLKQFINKFSDHNLPLNEEKLSLTKIYSLIEQEIKEEKLWIMPDDTIIPVEDHLKYIKSTDSTSIDGYRQFNKALSNDWVRISISDNEVNANTRHMTRAIHVIKKFFLKNILKHKKTVNIDTFTDNVSFATYDMRDKERFLKFLN